MVSLIVIWSIICIIFLGLTILHAFLYFGKIKKLEVGRLQKPGISIKIAGQSIDKPMEDLIEQLNLFVDALNKGNQKANGAQTLGYAMAFVTALISLILTIMSVQGTYDVICGINIGLA